MRGVLLRVKPARFYSKETIGFIEEVGPILEANMEEIHAGGLCPLGSLRFKPMVSAMVIEFHPEEFLNVQPGL